MGESFGVQLLPSAAAAPKWPHCRATKKLPVIARILYVVHRSAITQSSQEEPPVYNNDLRVNSKKNMHDSDESTLNIIILQ